VKELAITHRPATCSANLSISGKRSRACRAHHRKKGNLPELDLDEMSGACLTSMRAGMYHRTLAPDYTAAPRVPWSVLGALERAHQRRAQAEGRGGPLAGDELAVAHDMRKQRPADLDGRARLAQHRLRLHARVHSSSAAGCNARTMDAVQICKRPTC